ITGTASSPILGSASRTSPLRIPPTAPRDVLLLNWRDLTNPEGGGSELYVEQVAARLAAKGDNVTFFCADHGNAPRDEVKDGVRYVRRGSLLPDYLWAAALLPPPPLGHSGPIVDVHIAGPFHARLGSRRTVVELGLE